MKQLTTEQIDALFAFTKKHLVEHYDVQVELVDHLANAIEAQWKVNPNISFEDALQKEYKNFGVFGFSGLVEQKQVALQNHYWKIIKKEIISFFSIPKIIFSVTLFYVLFQYFSNQNKWLLANDYIIYIALIATTIFMFFFLKNQIKTEKKWLIQNAAHYLFSLPITLIVYFRFGFTSEVAHPSLAKIIFNSISTEIYVLFLIILYTKIAPLLKEEIKQTEERFSKV